MKKGISLIVLVITIIVMIILAAAVVISMSNTGIIEKASQAVNLTDEKSVQDLAALVWAETYLDETKRANIENEVMQELEKHGVKTDKWNIQVSNTGIIISSKSNVQLITFTVAGETFQAEANMTWGGFVSSKYNTKNFSLYSDDTVINSDRRNVNYSGVATKKTDKIVSGGVYTLSGTRVPEDEE